MPCLPQWTKFTETVKSFLLELSLPSGVVTVKRHSPESRLPHNRFWFEDHLEGGLLKAL